MENTYTWVKRIDWKKWILGGLLGTGIGVFFADISNTLFSRITEIEIKVTVLAVYIWTGVQIYKIFKGKTLATEILLMAGVFIGGYLGLFASAFLGFFVFTGIYYHLENELKLNNILLEISAEMLSHLTFSLVLLLTLLLICKISAIAAILIKKKTL